MEYQFRSLVQWTGAPTPDNERKYHPFRAGYQDTLNRLDRELRHLRASKVVIEIDLPASAIRLDGRPRADAPTPKSPGVVLNFQGCHGPLRFACDDCRSWQDNLRAIAMTLERLRLADLYGVTKGGEQYRGWNALPPPIVTPPPMTVEEAAQIVCGLANPDATPDLAINHVEYWRAVYRHAAKQCHPDVGGNEADFKRLQVAKTVLDKHHENDGRKR